MIATASKIAVAPTRVQTARRQTVVCSAVQPQQQQEVQNRRAVLGLMAAAVLGLGATGAAEATNLAPKNASAASMEGYNMEGTKKQGISPKRKKQLLAKLKANAAKVAVASK